MWMANSTFGDHFRVSHSFPQDKKLKVMSFAFRKNSNLAYTLVAAFLGVHPRVIETNVGQRSLRRIRMHICMPETDSEDAWTQRCREGLGVASPSMFSVFCEGGLYIGP